MGANSVVPPTTKYKLPHNNALHMNPGSFADGNEFG